MHVATKSSTSRTTHRPTRRRAGRLAAIAALGASVFTAASVSSPAAPTAAAPVRAEGIACTPASSTRAGYAGYVLTAKEGTIQTPDGNSLWMWGYAAGNGAFQYPGPVLCVNEGDQVSITLRNTLPVRTSIQFMGIDSVLANGEAAMAQFDGGGVLQSLTNDVGQGESIAYTFTAGRPGTYLYQSGNDPELQVEMGLVGALIVRPAMAVDTAGLPAGEAPLARLAYDDQRTRYSSEHEYLVMLTELDPDLHYAVEEGNVLTSSMYQAAYTPRYFMINGRSFPDVIAPNGAKWLPNQPYGALAHVEPVSAANPLPALIRYLAVGGEPYPFHPHSNHEDVIAKDGRLLADTALDDTPVDLSMEKFAITVDPGSTIDALFTWQNVEDYSSTNPVPLPLPSANNLTEGDYWNGSPYLGENGALNPEVQGKNQCGEYYHVAHNHNLAEATNYGAAFGGQLTLIRVDPANATNCGNA
ncbi:MAG: multicopper oxidase domain-containing protein [Actinobacteria bacterium]|nr:multicopper oxidase domain-containing protein [Actinomycetota bacterium]